jgi:DNA-binding PadR family transcriptional regulator
MGVELGNGQVDLLLLAILQPGAAHGYAVIAALKERSEGAFDFAEGTVYPALHRLEAAGLISSSREVANGRQRRVYSLTRRGRASLKRGREEWEDTVSRVRSVLAVTL